MKPAFALSFSTAGISLHHFSDGDWFCVGDVSLDAPDFSDQVKALRDKGFALENDLNCKLVLPADQVRFLSLETGDEDATGQSLLVQTALTDATPYTLEDLRYDTASDGAVIHVAAIARQTLDEAMAFANDYGFVPTQVTTNTDEQDYPSEPEFLAPRNPAPAEETPVSALPVHAIAAEEKPTEFRAAAAAEHHEASLSNRLEGYGIPISAAAALGIAAVLMWAFLGSGDDDATLPETALVEEATQETPPKTAVSEAETPESSPITAEPKPAEKPTELTAVEPAPETSVEDTDPKAPKVSPTDAAILEALKIAPTEVEPIETPHEPEQLHAGAQIGSVEPLSGPASESPDAQFIASTDRSDLSRDAVAPPLVTGFAMGDIYSQPREPSASGTRFDLDERGLVSATAEGTLNPDGVLVFLGRPSKVPPEVPVRFEQEPIEEDPTTRLAELRPNPRPSDLIERFERQQLGGRTLAELAVLRPKLRPASLQQSPQVDETPTALAVVRVPRPKLRPAGVNRPASTNAVSLGSTAAIERSTNEPDTFQPRAVAPKIPSSASVARQATIDNAINLRKLNLIGVYGTPANRRALVRLPSGRYKKLKVGDRLDGGNVVAISDSELRYQKRGQNVTLKMPRS